jgi:hypothetical protein
MNNIKTPTDEQILRYAEDLGVLKGYAVDNYTRWVYIHDVTGYDDYVTVDATSEVLALARYAASLAAPAARVWHSMETAPKDGRYILGHNKTVDGEDDYAVVFWFESVGHSGSWNTGTYNWEPEEWTPCDGISPVAVTEGLPEKKDCDPNGYFWVFVEDDKRWEWMHIGDMNWQYRDHHGYTHWAPWWAFPLPEVK